MSYYQKHSDSTGPFIFILLIIMAILWLVQTSISTNIYNNGICRNCGGIYEYQQAVSHGSHTYYLYKCNRCNNLIETYTYFKGSENKNGM